MRAAILLSRYFPPMFDVGGKRAYRFARYLPDLGWRPVVCTSPVPRARPTDPTPLRLPPEAVVDRGLVPPWWPEKKRRPSDATIAAPVTTAARPRRPARWAFPVGEDSFLAARTARHVRRLAKQHDARVIFATSSPYPMLVHGLAAARATGLPLVLDLRDPWTLNFLQRGRPRWVRHLEQRVEHRLFRGADKILFTCEAASEAYRGAYPDVAGRIETITNAYDPAQRPSRGERRGPIELVHFGNCYGPRRMETVLRALAAVRDADGLPETGVRVRNLGRMGAADVDLARQLGLSGLLEYGPAVPYEAGLEILAAADAQLLLSYGDETLFLPAKLFDYLLTGSPVLCVSQPSELTEIVANTGVGRSVAPGDVQAARAALEAIFAARDGRPYAHPRPSVVEQFAAPSTAQQLAAVFDAVT